MAVMLILFGSTFDAPSECASAGSMAEWTHTERETARSVSRFPVTLFKSRNAALSENRSVRPHLSRTKTWFLFEGPRVPCAAAERVAPSPLFRRV